ncbi:MAG: hypothetical protein EAZ06_09290 [Cytophagales bacterium]|nr:MAG: hypothetical protein EAZ06_09290 [Cytophagales bacterium]
MKYIQQYTFLFFLFFGFSSQSFGQQWLCNDCPSCYNLCVSNSGGDLFKLQECERIQMICRECQRNPRAYRDCNLYTPPPPAPPKECFETENPYNPPAGFNWEDRLWKVWVKTKNGVRENYYSPFYDDESDNINSDLEFLNINIPIKPTNLDGQPRDGWVLLYHKIGKSATDPMTYPMFVFYNKYRATIRVFWLLGSTTEQDYTKGTIEMSYGTGTLYRSNVFSTHKTPMVALEKGMPGDATLDVVSQFSNDPFEPFWIFGEFPVVYDPCACEYENGK